MNDRIKPLKEVSAKERPRFGGKCAALAGLAGEGFRVPDAVCIDSGLYRDFVTQTGLLRKIHFELNRKRFEQMRWEEIWDAALRIRNMFITTEIPEGVRASVASAVGPAFADRPVAVRSSAAMEDSAEVSFAGLHESYVNVVGTASILDHIKLVWASLWSDRALLYRQELGLDVEASTMSVVVQELVAGDASGVIFSRDPDDASRAVVEAVYGLNQALVDGTVEPDRWRLDRETGAVLSHHPAERSRKMVTAPDGVRLVDLDEDARTAPPLAGRDLAGILKVALKAEEVFGRPQDVEWTVRAGEVYVLQSRPITVGARDGEDLRTWYLTLTRSFENLKALRERLENEVIPGMAAETERLAEADLDSLADEELALEIKKRRRIYDEWEKVYREVCIPFAHGMRLFGQVYNDVMKPRDAYEFMDLLSAASTIGLTRNRLLDKMASLVRNDARLAGELEGGAVPGRQSRFAALLEDYLAGFGDLAGSGAPEGPGSDSRSRTIGLLLELAKRPPAERRAEGSRRRELEEAFLTGFPDDRRQFAEDLLDLGRASYRWRDDDNIYLARIEAEMSRALAAGRARGGRALEAVVSPIEKEIEARQAGLSAMAAGAPPTLQTELEPGRPSGVRARQLTGQPAGPGIATGKARVIAGTQNLFDFRAGEVLVCDAIEPEITFIVPLAAGIVERRGGMLIHGAIIAREYGIPCVTGVPEAARLIATGDTVTVDGYLGIVILEGAIPPEATSGRGD